MAAADGRATFHRMTPPHTSPALAALLSRRPDELQWLGPTALSGFFFAVAAAPELIEPSEWLELVFGPGGPEADSEEELQAAVEALFALYNESAALARVYDEPALPAWIAVRADPEANVGGDAPLASWSRGFAYGHRWLADLWDHPLPDGLDQQFGAVMICLTFFGLDERLPALMRDVLPGREVPDVAALFIERFSEGLAGYTEMGRALEEALAEADDEGEAPPRPAATGRNQPCPCGSGIKYKRCCERAVH